MHVGSILARLLCTNICKVNTATSYEPEYVQIRAVSSTKVPQAVKIVRLYACAKDVLKIPEQETDVVENDAEDEVASKVRPEAPMLVALSEHKSVHGYDTQTVVQEKYDVVLVNDVGDCDKYGRKAKSNKS